MRRCRVWAGAVLFALLGVACSSSGPASGPLKTHVVYRNDFSAPLGPEWKNEGGDWNIENGALHSRHAMNKDLVLTTPLPENAVVELTLLSHSPQVDVKFRAWGDMAGNMHDGAYHFILGGWNNSISTLAPLGEHDPRRIERRDHLQAEHRYHAKLVRQDGHFELSLDGKPFLKYDDPKPLDPARYKYFSFANWKSDCEFDDLVISAIDK